LGCPTLLEPSSLFQAPPAPVSIAENANLNTSQLEPEADVSPISEPSSANEHSTTRSAARPSKPEPPTEFQRFVTASTGERLPIFGAELFRNLPGSFVSTGQALAPRDLIIGPDDELRIHAWGQVNFNTLLRVSSEGEIYIPKVGAIHVAGLLFSEVTEHVRDAMQHVYRNFEITVDAGEIHSIQIYVTGFAHQSGEYTVSALNTLVDAIFLCGGPSNSGSMRHVILKRNEKLIIDFDLYRLLISGDKAGDVPLQRGDVLYFPPVGPQAAIFGSIHLSGIYELRGKANISDLIAMAGGASVIASNEHISIERIDNHAQRRAFTVTPDREGLDTPLNEGDIVRIDPIISQFRETVTLRGGVATPGTLQMASRNAVK
jgi:protein involved in polysaccharide export with SLBB domain